jgi:signal transduction histidine kinase/ligand-binding sensor domain-containing protein
MAWAPVWTGVLVALFTIGATPMPIAPAAPWANLADPVFTHVDTSSLPEPGINAVVQDSQGFIWVANGSGIARFDGYTFKVYWPVENDPTGLPKGGINALLADPHGGLWIGSASSGLVHYDPRTDTFRDWRPNAPHHTGPVSVAINSLALAKDGRLWLGGSNGVERFDPATGTFTSFALPGQKNLRSVASVLIDRDGTVWAEMSIGGLHRLSPGSRRFRPFPLAMFGGGKAQLNSLFEDREGRLWIGGFQEIFVVDRSRRQVVRLVAADDPRALAPGANNTFAEPRPGQIWIGASRNVINVIDPKTMRVRRINADPENPVGLPNGQVVQFLLDRSGLLWIATQQGLLVQNPASRGISSLSVTRADLRLRGRQISALAYASDGSLIAAHSFAERGNIVRLDWNERPQTIDLPDANVNSVFALAAAPDGTIWIGGTDGVCRWKPGGAPICPAKPSELRNSLVDAMLFTHGTLYVGSANSGLTSYNPLTGATVVFREGSGPSSLNADIVTGLYEDHAGRIWIGTGTGLNRLDPKTRRVVRFVNDPNDSDSIEPGFVGAIVEDRSGRIWAGSAGGISILQFNGNGRVNVRRLDRSSGLPDDDIDGLAIDPRGDIWVSTNNGVSRIDPVTFRIRALGLADGAPSDVYSAFATKAPDGTIFFGGLRSITVIAPNASSPWNYAPPVVLTALKAGGNNVAVSGLDRSGARIELPAGEHSISAEFAALDYSDPQALLYEYRLDGFDRDWTSSDSAHRVATYTNLPPGNYTLRVRATNRLGAWSTSSIALNVVAQPAWYETWWFRILVALLVVAALLSIYLFRTASLRRRARQLRALVEEQTRELRDANASLKASAETLEQLGAMGQGITANLDLRAVCETLYRDVRSLLDARSMMIWRLDSSGTMLDVVFAKEDDAPVSHNRSVPVDDPNANSARAVRERREVLFEWSGDGLSPSHIPGSLQTRSSLFAPLMIADRVLGALSIQTDTQHAYGERERAIFRNLCSYGAIAIENAATLDEIKRMQGQLVQQEKMAGLGTLVAGVTHEINNPANFTHLGAQELAGELERFRRFLEDMAGDDAPPEVLADINARIDRLGARASTITEGTTRIRDLVKDLRTFSRLDEADRKIVRIGDSLQSTLNLVRTQYKKVAEIRCELSANPEMECWPAQLNQVFMNLVVNACQAIATRRRRNPLEDYDGVLTIRDHIEDDYLVLEFEDNGCGIPKAALGHIFEPFFTTKGVGEGTGLGLSISYGIIEKHGGSIDVRSVEGEGTCFTVRLPLTNEPVGAVSQSASSAPTPS